MHILSEMSLKMGCDIKIRDVHSPRCTGFEGNAKMLEAFEVPVVRSPLKHRSKDVQRLFRITANIGS